MKNLFLIATIFILTPLIATAQSGSGFGIRAGVNYNSNGDYYNSATTNYQKPDGNVGYHVGVFGKIGSKIYFKPELVYTATKSDYTNDSFTMQKLDAPLLVGVKIVGPLSVFAGPSLQYILDSKLGDVTIDNIEEDFSVGLNFGLGVSFKKIGIDLRYERGFSDNEATFINNNNNTNINIGDRLDTRPDQLILSVSLML